MRYVEHAKARYVEHVKGPPAPIAATERVVAFQRSEVIVGLIVSAGSSAMTVPGTTTEVPPSSAVLLVPIAALLIYGLLLMRGRPRQAAGRAPLWPDERLYIRRRTIGWGGVVVVAMLIPPTWIWPIFIAGLTATAYWLHRLRMFLRRSRR